MPSALTPNSVSSTPGCSKIPSFSFKEVMLKQLDDVQNGHVRQQNPSGKQGKVKPLGSIVTNEQFVAEEESENEKIKRKQVRERRKKQTKATKNWQKF